MLVQTGPSPGADNPAGSTRRTSTSTSTSCTAVGRTRSVDRIRARTPLTATALLAATLLCSGLCSGCAVPQAREEGATRSARNFGAGLRAGDVDRVCTALSARARSAAAGPDETCARGVRALRLAPGGEVRRTDVSGRQARVVMSEDTLFLSLFPDGWKVTGAGCAPRGSDLPYDCDLQGS